MAEAIDFYFDFSSRCRCLACERIDAFAVRDGRSVDWQLKRWLAPGGF